MSKRHERYLKPANRIVGIHNYCDAWCRRCAFSSRCAVFAAQQESDRGPESRDPENKEFWDRLHATMSDTLEMIREHCIEQGIDPDHPLTPEEEAEQKHVEEQVDANELVRMAGDYMMSVKRWLDAAEPVLKAKEDELNLRARLELPGVPAPGPEAAEVRELLDVVQWYYTFIPPKVARAVSVLQFTNSCGVGRGGRGVAQGARRKPCPEGHGDDEQRSAALRPAGPAGCAGRAELGVRPPRRISPGYGSSAFLDPGPPGATNPARICELEHLGLVEGEPECADGLPRDSDGSAKVALISIERSMAAWTKLRAHLPEQRDALLDMLVALDRLRRGLERDFPEARAFVRPGFDEAAPRA